jgi:hypothetical protein
MYVSDMSDFAVSTAESAAINLSSINFETLISEVDKLLENQFPDRKLYFKIEDEVKPITIFADIKILKESFLSIFQALSENTDATSIIINGSDNPIEGAAEIQILCSSSSLADQMVGIYRENSNNLITTLKYDRNDILLNLASAASSIRMMNGSMSLESLGAGEGNLVLLNLPSVVG